MHVNRRQFLTMMGLGAYALIVNGCDVGNSSSSNGSSSNNGNTNPTEYFINPPDIQTTRNGNIVEVNLTVEQKDVYINGQRVRLLTYNGSYPAPTIRVKFGDILRVNFKNNIPSNIGNNILGKNMSITNLHTHGWHVSPVGNSDNIFLEINSGETFDYEYDLSKQWGGMMGFYHPHKHGTVAEQMWRGLCGGALIVEDDTDDLKDFEEKILILSDVSISGEEPISWNRMDYMRILGDTVMVNGQVDPVMEVRKGEVQRWRIINASVYRIYRLSLENHSFYLVGTESGLLDKPVKLNEIILSPGERIDILVKFDQSQGSYKFVSKPVFDSDGADILTVIYVGTATDQSIPSTIQSDVAQEVENLRQMDTSSLRKVNMTLNFVGGGGMGSGGMGMKGAINGGVFGENTYILESNTGTYEVWTITNPTGMPHPFHQHVDSVVVLEISGGDSGYANLYTTINAYKDTVIVPPHGYIKLLVPVKDYAGDTVFHCHILGHEDIGMMGLWRRK